MKINKEKTMQSGMKFYVYNHHLIIKENHLITRKFICLKNSAGNMRFTDFHKYIIPNRKTIRNVSDDGNNRFDFVVKFLNYAFFYKRVNSLDSITLDVIKTFLNSYGCGTLPDDINGRTKATVEKCITSIMDFIDNLINDRKSKCSIKKEELFRSIPFRNQYGKVIEKKVPVFDVVYTGKSKNIFRDIPNSAFEILFSHIAQNHTNLLMLASLSAFCGLRPSESCNVRREDSILGPGVIFTIIDGTVDKVQIDIRKELCLRSDLIPTGKIKKERIQTMPLMFIDAFVSSYNKYMEYIKGHKYESEYGPMSINKQGKAITYDNYYQSFVKIIKNEIIPIYLADTDPEVINYGRLLMENNLSPHVFRHWYTVQLVLAGIDNVGELMAARGDSSPESALTYIQNKGELEKQYRKVNNEMFNYLSWTAEKLHKEKE